MASPIIGRNVMAYVYDPVTELDIPWACALDCTVTIETDTKEITSQTSAWVREFKPNLSQWQVNINALVILNDKYNYLTQLTAQKDRTQILLKIVFDNGTILGLSIFSGSGYIISSSISTPDAEVSTIQCTIQGSGPYSLSGTSVDPSGSIIIQGSVVQIFQGVATAGTTITLPGSVGLDMLYISRGGVAAQPLGSLTGNGATFDPVTGTITFATELFDGENILLMAQ